MTINLYHPDRDTSKLTKKVLKHDRKILWYESYRYTRLIINLSINFCLSYYVLCAQGQSHIPEMYPSANKEKPFKVTTQHNFKG